jgi:hypothetical protein
MVRAQQLIGVQQWFYESYEPTLSRYLWQLHTYRPFWKTAYTSFGLIRYVPTILS